MKTEFTYEEIDNLKKELEFKLFKRFGINAGGIIVKIIRETFKEKLK